MIAPSRMSSSDRASGMPPGPMRSQLPSSTVQRLPGEDRADQNEERAADGVGRVDRNELHRMLPLAQLWPKDRSSYRLAQATDILRVARRDGVAKPASPSGDERQDQRRCAGSVGVLAGSFDDRLPARDLAFELGLQRGRRRVGLGRGRGAELGEAGDDVRVLQRDLQRLRQALGDLGRRALRRIEAVPDADLEAGQAGLPRRSARRAARRGGQREVTA